MALPPRATAGDPWRDPAGWTHAPENYAEPTKHPNIYMYDLNRQNKLWNERIRRPCYKCKTPGGGAKAYETKDGKPICYKCCIEEGL